MNNGNADKMVTKTLRLPASLLDQAKHAARKQRRNVSDYLRIVLEDHFRRLARRSAA